MSPVAAIRVRVNGEDRDLAENTSVSDLLGSLGVSTPRVAVEFNREILSKSLYSQTRLSDGDTIEVVQFVGGG